MNTSAKPTYRIITDAVLLSSLWALLRIYDITHDILMPNSPVCRVTWKSAQHTILHDDWSNNT